MLCGKLIICLALFRKMPLPAPCFKRSRKVFMCTPAQVSYGENLVVAGDQVGKQANGQLHSNVIESHIALCSGPQAPRGQATSALRFWAFSQHSTQVTPDPDDCDMPGVYVLSLVSVPRSVIVRNKYRNAGPSGAATLTAWLSQNFAVF